jgi:hypothetical protein
MREVHEDLGSVCVCDWYRPNDMLVLILRDMISLVKRDKGKSNHSLGTKKGCAS